VNDRHDAGPGGRPEPEPTQAVAATDALRRRAEQRIADLLRRHAGSDEKELIDRLTHELGVYQVELEIQNEQLRQSQQSLEASRDLYMDLYEQAPVGYVTLDLAGRVLRANTLAEAYLACRSEQLAGTRFVDRLPAADRLRFQQRFTALLTMSPVPPIELRLLPDTGRIVLASLRLTRNVRSEAEPACRVALADITERVAAQRDVSRLAAIVASSEDAIASLELDGRVASWNAAAEAMFGYAAAEVVGRPLDHIVPQERQAAEGEVLKRALAGERIAPFESERCRRDGTRLPVSITLSPIHVEPEHLAGVSLIMRDISGRKRDERLLYKRMRQLDALAQAGQALILGDRQGGPERHELFDLVRIAVGSEIYLNYGRGESDGTLRIVSQHGLSEAGRLAMNKVAVSDSLCGAALGRRAPLIVESLQSSGLAEARNLRAEGVRCYAGFPLVVNGAALGVAAFASTSRDRFREGDLQVMQTVCSQVAAMLERERLVEELRSRERSLQAADRRKDEFIATLAHELRNPLAPIRNAVNILRHGDLPPQRVDWCREVIDRQVTQMSRLLEDLLDVSRVGRNRVDLRCERMRIKEVVEAAIEAAQPLIDAQGHQLAVDAPDEGIVVYADRARLTQVVANLLDNAAKYTDAGGRIELTVRREGQIVRIGVRDNGIGISAEQLGNVFEMFSQLRPAIGRARGGLGIGLSLSRGLVAQHGGTIEARSEGPGHGSEFIVRLPIVLQAASSARDALEPRPVADAHGRRVLIVDDNVDAAQTLAAMLGLQDLETRAAFGGADGYAAAEAWRPDAAVIDLGMPGMNGYELCTRLREQSWGVGMMLIACTGWGQSQDRERSRLAGFDYHIVKPVDPEAVRELLASRPVGDDTVP
jgi:PAS domain S-box-containing protein